MAKKKKIGKKHPSRNKRNKVFVGHKKIVPDYGDNDE